MSRPGTTRRAPAPVPAADPAAAVRDLMRDIRRQTEEQRRLWVRFADGVDELARLVERRRGGVR